MIERCVVVQRQKDGYGLSVSGDHPVFVHTVKTDGPAFCAGVRQGDRILKVNGMPVTSQNHADVVRMISGGQNVALTLLGKPTDIFPQHMYTETKLEKPEISKLIISEPMPVAEKEEWRRRRRDMLVQMLEDERKHVEGLRESSENGEKLERALQRIHKLQSQLRGGPARPAHSLGNLNSTSHTISSQHTWMHPSQHESDLVSDSENDDDMLSNDNGGLFSSIVELKSHPAHLAVFISFLLNHGNPSSLFFYLITDAYQQTSASAKELRRWAFEIFTTFIVPNSPMPIGNIDHNVIQPIDKALANTADAIRDSDSDILRKVFIPARQRAETEIRSQLAEFRLKRNIANLFDAAQVAETNLDASLEWRIAESVLLRALESTVRSANPEYEACSVATQALLSSLATLIKVVLCLKPNVTHWEKLLEKCPTFVTKDKATKGKSKTITKKSVQGHQFTLTQVNIVHYCYQCRDVIWGMQPSAYSCANCNVVTHKQCASQLIDTCYPATQSKWKDNKENKLKGRPKSKEEEDKIRRDGSLPRDISISKLATSDSGIGAEILHEKVVGRSQSMRGRMPSDPISESSKRGRSAQSWGTDLTPADEAAEFLGRPGSFRTRDISYERALDVTSVSGSSGLSHSSLPDEEIRKNFEKLDASAFVDDDSDLEVESDVPLLERLVGWEVIRHLKPKEKTRQEVVNELFHTEKTHVRNLKILHKLFYLPMKEHKRISSKLVDELFSNLEEVLEIHVTMNQRMKAAVAEWKKDPELNGLYGDIGDLMNELFGGEAGVRLCSVTSEFCKNQKHALEHLSTKCKKDDALGQFLFTAEQHPLCRKLKLKDMLPVEMQRLVKYPLLLETIVKYTHETSDEQEKLVKALACMKSLLDCVNTSVREADDLRKLEELQRRMDTTIFDREFAGHDFASLDLRKYHLVHEGPITCRFNRGKMVELHAVLLEQMLVLLTKQGEGSKLLLKCLEPSRELKWAPVLPLYPLVAREKANDKRTFFLVFNSMNGAQIYELMAPTATDRKVWYRLITEQVEYTQRVTVGASPYFDVTAAGSYVDASNDGQMAKVHVLTHPRLVSAREIRVEQPTVLEHAKPILTPTERLRRADAQIFEALADKQAILAQFLPGEKSGSADELQKLTETLGGLAVADLKQRDPKELAMATIVHGNRLIDSINQGMMARKVGEDMSGVTVLELDPGERHLPSVPCYKLTAIAAPLMNHLKAMMALVQEQQSEVQTLRQQVQHYKDIAEGNHGLSVSEETLTDMNSDDRRLLNHRFLPAHIPPQPPPPTSLPPPV